MPALYLACVSLETSTQRNRKILAGSATYVSCHAGYGRGEFENLEVDIGCNKWRGEYGLHQNELGRNIKEFTHFF
jgi:hypothetical protein